MRKRLIVNVILEAEGPANEAVLESMIQRMFEADDVGTKVYLISSMMDTYGKSFKRIQVTDPRE